MRVYHTVRLVAATMLLLSAPALAGTQPEVVSSMRNVNAVAEAFGYRLNPAYDANEEMEPGDLAPVQAFEIIRPDNGPLTIGRLYTSCTCIQLRSPKRHFAANERAVLQLHNTQATPFNGQVYAIYVQITSPVRTTLRFDTFVQSHNISLPNSTTAAAGETAPATGETNDLAAANDNPDIEIIVPAPLSGAADQVAAATAETNATVEAAKAAMDAHFNEQSGETPAADPAPTGDKEPPSTTVTTTPAADPLAASLDAILADMGDEDYPTLEAVQTTQAATSAPVSVRPPAAAEPEPVAAPTPLPPPTPAEPARATSQIAADADAKPIETVSLITIGVRDLARSIRFYEELGWRRAARNKYDQTAFFQLNGQVLALYPLSEHLKEQNMESATPSPGGITLAIHVPSKDKVFSIYQSFIKAGGASLKAPTEMPSGAVTSYVADPDGNPWEISWVPQFKVDSDGNLWLP